MITPVNRIMMMNLLIARHPKLRIRKLKSLMPLMKLTKTTRRKQLLNEHARSLRKRRRKVKRRRNLALTCSKLRINRKRCHLGNLEGAKHR